MSAPRITIITVCFNSVATIADTLSAVATQRNAHYEHLVVDGASTDGTVELVQRFSP